MGKREKEVKKFRVAAVGIYRRLRANFKGFRSLVRCPFKSPFKGRPHLYRFGFLITSTRSKWLAYRLSQRHLRSGSISTTHITFYASINLPRHSHLKGLRIPSSKVTNKNSYSITIPTRLGRSIRRTFPNLHLCFIFRGWVLNDKQFLVPYEKCNIPLDRSCSSITLIPTVGAFTEIPPF